MLFINFAVAYKLSIELHSLDKSRVRVANIELKLHDPPLIMLLTTKPLVVLVASVLLTCATCAIALPLPQPRDGPSNGPPGGLGAPAVSLGGLTNLNSLLPGLATLSLVSLPPTSAAGLAL